MKTHPVPTSCSVASKHAFTYSRLHPHAPHPCAVVFPTLPLGGDSGHLYCKIAPFHVARNISTCMHAHKTLHHLGLISPRSRTAVAGAFMCCGGQQRNAGRMVLRAPTEGKLQGAASHQNSGENAAATLGPHQIFSGLVFLSLLIQSDTCLWSICVCVRSVIFTGVSFNF